MIEGVEVPTRVSQPVVITNAEPVQSLPRPKVDIHAALGKTGEPEGPSTIDSSIPGTRVISLTSVESKNLKNEVIDPKLSREGKPGETLLTTPDQDYRPPEVTEFADNGRGSVNGKIPQINKTGPTEI